MIFFVFFNWECVGIFKMDMVNCIDVLNIKLKRGNFFFLVFRIVGGIDWVFV